MQPDRSSDLARTTLQLLALSALIAGSFWIMRPFLAAIFWAATIAVATWPLLLWLQSWLGGKRSLAVGLMIAMLVLIIVVPLYVAIAAIVENVQHVGEWSRLLANLNLPQPPGFVEAIPLVGGKIAARWRNLASLGPKEISAYLSPFARRVALWTLNQVGNLGLVFIQLVLTVIFTGILYANGDAAARGAVRFARRLAGRQGEKAVYLGAQAVQGVALGVVATAIIQSVLAGIGLAVAGVQFAMLLTAVMFVLAIAQIGPVPVLIGAVIWAYSTKGAVWGSGLLVWSIFCGALDNFLRPLLISRRAHIPLALVFVGVLGGLIAFGVIGLFIGPVVLVVAYTLLTEWMSEEEIAPR